jgi:hypothetical protein
MLLSLAIIVLGALFWALFGMTPRAVGQVGALRYPGLIENYQSSGCSPFCTQQQINQTHAINEGVRARNEERAQQHLHQLELKALRQEQAAYLEQMDIDEYLQGD